MNPDDEIHDVLPAFRFVLVGLAFWAGVAALVWRVW